jgi:hypothetical protein
MRSYMGVRGVVFQQVNKEKSLTLIILLLALLILRAMHFSLNFFQCSIGLSFGFA